MKTKLTHIEIKRQRNERWQEKNGTQMDENRKNKHEELNGEN